MKYPNSLKTKYKNIIFRSSFETTIAFFLDSLNIKWEYEPQNFRLTNGNSYLPDFYLPDLKTYLEVKGILYSDNLNNIIQFCKDTESELVVILPDNALWFSAMEYDDGNYNDTLQIGKCSDCKKIFFCGITGSYHCRNCKNHNGDHDIVFSSYFMDEKIIFNDIESIKLLINILQK